MNIAEMAITVGLVTEFIKKAVFSIFHIDIAKRAAVILSILVSAGVVFYSAIQSVTPITFALIPIFIQVAIAANAGFALLKVRNTNA